MSTTTEKWTIFGERLKTELERQEMSLRQFAEKAGLTLTTACRYVHSQRTPRATEILKAAKALGTTCDYMLGLSDDPHKTRDGWAKAGFHDLPPAQPETHEKRTETHACDYINRKDAIDAVENIDCSDGVGISALKCEAVDDGVTAIKALPSAQPDIIRCNACKHWTQTTGNMRGFGLGDCDYINAKLVNCNGFCYWAERRTDE